MPTQKNRWRAILAGLSVLVAATPTMSWADDGRAVPAAGKTDQLAGLRADMDKMIALLEAKDYEKLINEHFAEKWKLDQEKVTIEQFIQVFKKDMAPRLLTLLKEARTMTPTFSADGKSAALKWPDGKARMTFRLLDSGKWGFNT